MASLMTFQSTPPILRQQALELLFQNHSLEERTLRIASTNHLLDIGRLNPESLFIIREKDTVTGVLLCLKIPGALALVWPPQVIPGIQAREREKLLVEQSAQWLKSRGVKIAQALLLTGELSLAGPLLHNGYQHLSSLRYLKHDLKAEPGLPVPSNHLVFQPLTKIDESLFTQTLQETYIDTLDIPELRGLRTTAEIIIGHQSQGKFDPSQWWLAFHHGQPAGVLLLTDFPETAEWDLSYLGLIPSHRRQGLGQELVHHALTQACLMDAAGLTVSVDVRNHPACRLYANLGFRDVEHREIVLGLWPA